MGEGGVDAAKKFLVKRREIWKCLVDGPRNGGSGMEEKMNISLLTRRRPQFLAVDICHVREIQMPIREVAMKSASQMGSQEKSLSPEIEYSLFIGDEREVVISTRRWH